MKSRIAKFSVVFFAAFAAAGTAAASQLKLSLAQSDYANYYNASASSVTWDYDSGYIYLPLGSGDSMLRDYYIPADALGFPHSTAQCGFSFIAKDDCYISEVSRFAPNGGNSVVRIWTDDENEHSGGISAPWFDLSISQNTGWDTRSLDFKTDLYPLTKGNTYWCANVQDGIVQHTVGKLDSYHSHTALAGIVDTWYITNSETAPGSSGDPSSNLNVLQNLQGIPDLTLNRFNSSGSMVTKPIDLGASRVSVESFKVTFITSTANIILNSLATGGSGMSYDIKYETITALGRAPECSANFKISQSSDNITYGDFTANLSSVTKRYIKIFLGLTTQHRGLTPIVDNIDMQYNSYPEQISASSVSPLDGSLETQKSPVFRWSPSYDHDGDTVTYTFSLSSGPAFGNILFSTTRISVPVSTYVAVAYPGSLSDRTSYFFRIDIKDSHGAETPHNRTFAFKTELKSLYVVSSGIENTQRLLASDVQNGFTLKFSKEVDTSTFVSAFSFVDASSSAVSYSFQVLSSRSLKIVPQSLIHPCWQYTFSVGTELKDIVGLNLSPAVTVNFLTLNNKNTEFTSSVSGSSMTVPSGGAPDSFYMSSAKLSIDGYQNLAGANTSALSSAFIVPVSTVTFSYSITDSAGSGISGLAGAILTIPYYSDPISVSGEASSSVSHTVKSVSSIDIKSSLLKIFKLNESNNQWAIVPGQQTVDTTGMTVTAHPASGGLFALLAYPSDPAENVQLRNVPNPFYKGSPTTIIYYLDSDASVEARIYTEIGVLIYDKKYPSGSTGAQTGVNEITWYGKNKDGSYVASGIYVLRLEIAGEKVRTRKIGFIR